NPVRNYQLWKKENKKDPRVFKNDVVYQIHTKRPTYAIRDAVVTVCVDAKQNGCVSFQLKQPSRRF
ncbi:MAG: hypothetical protein Q7J80_10535, partial [Anaerolineales bacterium]|nr:hypothetical protein [Anaerolineales bacterium]